MTEKLNHFVCPNCGHDFYTSGAYATCDACQTFFYASQSRTCKAPASRDVYEMVIVDGFAQWQLRSFVR